jgi:transcriptional regulator with XRE-family HTH domain
MAGMTVNDAVRAIREASGKSQQLFSTELGISLRAFAKYEKDQMPEPRQLCTFLEYARKNGHSRAERVFENALQTALGTYVPYSRLFYGPSPRSVKTVEYSFSPESLDALRQCLAGDASYAEVAPRVIWAVAEAIEKLAEREQDAACVKQFRAIRPKKRPHLSQ